MSNLNQTYPQSLTQSQRDALIILWDCDTEGALTSSKNGPGYIATGSAFKLEKLGFALVEIDRLFMYKVHITEAGRALVRGWQREPTEAEIADLNREDQRVERHG